ncbi:MAG: hypothetical protein ACR2RV_09950 [Verrucomicrobiales bacterium]
MKRARLVWTVLIVAALIPVLWIAVSQLLIKHRSILATIERLDSSDVERVLVYEGDWPKGEPRIVEDGEKIKWLVDSLKTGRRYFPNHDRKNGFERVVIVEPQHLQFRVYQREGDSNSMIVGLGEWKSASRYRSFGDIQCALPTAWTEL